MASANNRQHANPKAQHKAPQQAPAERTNATHIHATVVFRKEEIVFLDEISLGVRKATGAKINRGSLLHWSNIAR
jgi:hypothetical protein